MIPFFCVNNVWINYFRNFVSSHVLFVVVVGFYYVCVHVWAVDHIRWKNIILKWERKAKKERDRETEGGRTQKRGEVKRDSFEFSVYSHAQRTHISLIEQKTRTGFCRLFSFLPLSISLFLFNFFDSPLQNLEREWFRYMDPAFYISQSFLLYKNTNIYR